MVQASTICHWRGILLLTYKQEFHAKCRASQELIVAQIPWATASAERSRNTHKAAKDSGSDSNTGNKLSRKARDNTPSKGRDEASDLTKEERLLASLLNANEELIEVFRIYDELEKMALNEMEEREAAKRSITETKLDRTVSFVCVYYLAWSDELCSKYSSLVQMDR